MRNFVLAFLLLLFFPSCRQDPDPATTAAETLVRWQYLLDKSLFDSLIPISTPKTIKWINSIREYTPEEEADTSLTVFKNIQCDIHSDTARCHYLVKIDGEFIRDTTRLVLLHGRWLVDIEDIE